MPQTAEVTFTDKFGDERVIRRGPTGPWKLKNTSTTPSLTINQALSLIGKRIHDMREKRGYTLAELATRAGLAGQPKQRMWEIENAQREHGLRLGTIYALAIALDVDVWSLLPAVEEVRHVVQPTTITTLAVAE